MASEPDSDLSRLVFADWLEVNSQPERAELIRLSCRLDPHRDRFDEAIHSLRQRVEELLRPEELTEREWRESIHEPMGHGATIECRRGSSIRSNCRCSGSSTTARRSAGGIRCSAGWCSFD
jgi:uncharacterized protein (TIGR02996 family)